MMLLLATMVVGGVVGMTVPSTNVMNVTKAHVDVSGCIKSGMSTRCTTCKHRR